MGWSFMRKPASVKAKLESLVAWDDEVVRRRVLRSAFVGRTEWYAAVELVYTQDQGTHKAGDREVYAAVFELAFRPRDPEGFTFGYKDATEHMGPVHARCPKSILDLLTPVPEPMDTEATWREGWRRRCREYHAARARVRQMMRDARPGDRVHLAGASIPFVDVTRTERGLLLGTYDGLLYRVRPKFIERLVKQEPTTQAKA